MNRLLSALVVAALALLTWRVVHFDLMVDDAFISFRYAANLVAGEGLVYNPGERVEGFSNLLWTLAVAALALVGVPPPIAAVALAAVCAAATLWLTWRGARQILNLEGGWALVAPLVVALNPSFALWVGGGLETISVALLLTWAWLEAMQGNGTRTGIALALLALSRPEGALWVLPAAALLVARGARGRPLATALALPLLAALGLLAFRLAYYGSPLPAPAYAKAAFGAASWLRGARYVGDFLWEDGALFILPLLLWARGPARTAAIAALGGALFAIQAGGDGLYRYRFMVHVLPLMALAIAAGLHALSDRGRRAGVVLVALACTVPFVLPDRVLGAPLEQQRWWERHWSRVGEALRSGVRPGSWLATNVAGRLPHASGLPTIDLLGLTDATIAHAPVDELGTGYAGHERAAPAYVLGRRPDLIFISVLDGLSEETFTSPAAIQERLRKGPLYRYLPLLEDPVFQQGWRPARIPVADGSEANLFVRRDSTLAGLRLLDWR